MLECRCPGCHQFLYGDDMIDVDTYITCDNCDRGFRAQDALCADCYGHHPFTKRDGASYVCQACGAKQPSRARLTA